MKNDKWRLVAASLTLGQIVVTKLKKRRLLSNNRTSEYNKDT